MNRGVALACALLSVSCFRIAEDRAERDMRVGQAALGELEVQVVDGLAAVRSFTGSEVVLWSQAPALQVRFLNPGSQDRTLTLRVSNVLNDARLTLSGGSARAGTRGAHKELGWELTVPAGETLAARVGPDDASLLEPWSFLVLGDVQDAIDEVQDVFSRMNDEDARFAIMLGDQTENGTTTQLERFRRELGGLDVPCYMTLGNHELGDSDVPFHDVFGRGSFSFDYRGVRISLLDSASATLDPLVHTWLDGWLADGRDQLHVVGMHIPLVDPSGVRNGSFSSPAEAHTVLHRMARSGVDLTLYGHIHSYYAYENAGMPAYVTGGGGAIPERFDGIGRHFLRVDAVPREQRLSAALVRVD